ncbi:MAG: sulfatase-like hydrolase/transferase [Candidatus Levybacteria bacterium]|nr:sulfatase-like hydrolase/transferase [Candidatus Levybacteria bacterium]
MKRSIYDLDQRSVVFITLDCCRFDTFAKSSIPFIKSLSGYSLAKTHGTYTLPAHMSFFMGYLPIAQKSLLPYYNPDVRQLWRLKSGRTRSLESVGIMLEGKNILDGYRNIGYQIIGSGGVRWFRNKTLTELFDTFLFYGPDDTTSVFQERRINEFALNNIDTIVNKVKKRKNFFLFLNCLETHVPYDTGEGSYSNQVREIINKASSIWGCKHENLKNVQVTKQELQLLHRAQIAALETVDKKIERLIKMLSRPLLIVITGDHGECFGEDMNWGHGIPYKQVMEVPLLVAFTNP